jgi:Ricin-type beta-trefoil lectin domain
MQEDLKKLSIRSRRIIAKDSRHPIVLERPDLVEKEVPLFIEQIRGSAPQPTNYGSTITAKTSQHWSYTLAGNLVNASGKKCLSASDLNNKPQNLALETCGHNQPTQIWSLPN